MAGYIAFLPPVAPHPRRFRVEAFWYSRRRGLATTGGGQYQLSLSERRAGPRHSGKVAPNPAISSHGKSDEV